MGAWIYGVKTKKEQGTTFENFAWKKFLSDSYQTPDTFKVYDYYDRATGVAVSVKTLNTTTKSKTDKPIGVYDSVKDNINAIIEFKHDKKWVRTF